MYTGGLGMPQQPSIDQNMINKVYLYEFNYLRL